MWISMWMSMWRSMRTVQMTLDEGLVEEVDRVTALLGVSRSAFTRDALRAAMERLHERREEERQRDGYRRQPVKPGELTDGDGDEDVAWGAAWDGR